MKVVYARVVAIDVGKKERCRRRGDFGAHVDHGEPDADQSDDADQSGQVHASEDEIDAVDARGDLRDGLTLTITVGRPGQDRPPNGGRSRPSNDDDRRESRCQGFSWFDDLRVSEIENMARSPVDGSATKQNLKPESLWTP
ncbi:hypothetical protein ABZ754_17610 [Micromonospora purpureochromogenes]|uniref:hypothetical protein n=1 Tax=Micromonospora purpureochromogenes TaxID=47872 RepID=UPI0033C72838